MLLHYHVHVYTIMHVVSRVYSNFTQQKYVNGIEGDTRYKYCQKIVDQETIK
mgnify:CR=1 FL=1